MGFFFAEHKNDKKVSRTVKTIDPEFLKKAGCKACKRNRSKKYYSPRMEPSGSDKPLVYVLGAGPSIEDDDSGEHFSDKSGKFLRSHFPKNWERRKYLRFNYCLNCGASDYKEASSSELDCCRNRIEEDIARTKPEIIVGVGELPLKWMLGAHSVFKWSGRRIPVKIKDHTCWFFPVLSPEEIIRKQRFTRSGKHTPNEYDQLYKHDIGNIVDFINSKNLPEALVEPEENYFKNIELIDGSGGTADIQKISKILDKLEKKERNALDYETTQLRPYYKDSKILCVAIGTYEYTVAFPLDHPDGWKSPRFRKQAHDLLKRFYKKCGRVLCHNVKFEQEWTEVIYGAGTIKKVAWDDSMAQGYCLDTRKRMLNLGVLTHIYLGFNLKEVTKVNAANWRAYPLIALLRYNALDSKYTDLLFTVQDQRIDNYSKLRKVYEHLVRTSTTIALTQIKGLVPNLNKVEEFSKDLQQKEEEIKKKIKRLREVRKYEARFGEFNPTSSDQLVVLLKEILDLGDKIKKPGKKGAKDKYSTDADSLVKIQDDTKLAQYVIDVRNVTKLRSTYVDAIRDQHTYDDGLMHPEYNVYFTNTGRLCVAEGTMIEVVRDLSRYPDGIPIEKIRKEDLVYTFDKDLKITLRRVKWAGKTGHKKVLRIHWQGQGGQHNGFLKVTPEHRILLIDGSYKRARDLKVGDRVLAMHMKVTSRSGFFASRNPGRISNQRFVYETVNQTKIQEGYYVHHKDHNKLNDTPENLELLAHSKHTSIHFKEFFRDPKNIRRSLETRRRNIEDGKTLPPARGIDSPIFKHLTKFQCLRIIARCRGKLTYTSSLYHGTFSQRLELHKISKEVVKLRYGNDGIYHSRGKVSKLLNTQGFIRTRNSLGIDFYKFKRLLEHYQLNPCYGNKACGLTRFRALRELVKVKGFISKVPYDFDTFKKKLEEWEIDWRVVKKRLESEDIVNNHIIVSIDWIDEYIDVYDLEVEDTHNFIANEICIHNSSNDPNAQNFPKRKDKWVRAVVGCPEGEEMTPLDYGQIEARIICCASHDEAFTDALWTGYDIHMEWAKKISKRYPKVIGGKRYLDDEKVIKTFRSVIKNSWVFPAFFGASEYSIGSGLGIQEGIMKELFEEFWYTFQGVKKWHTTITDFYSKHGYVETLTGRRRHGPLTPNECFNTPIQGTAADIVLNAMNVLSDQGYQAVLNVHDDLTFYLPTKQLEEKVEEIAEIMCLSPLEDFNFINVPISVEAERGVDWASCKEIQVYDSTMFGHKRSTKRRRR